MFVPAFVLGVSELNPDFALTNLNGERLQVIAFIVETPAALQIETPAVPVAGENAVTDGPTGQGIAHVGALVIGRVDPAIDFEQRNAAPFSEPDGLRLTRGNIAERSHADPLRCLLGHAISLLLIQVPRPSPDSAVSLTSARLSLYCSQSKPAPGSHTGAALPTGTVET